MSEKPHLLSRRFNMPILRTIDQTIQSLSLTGKIILYTLAAIFVVSGVMLLWNLNSAFLIEVPRSGGRLVEGVIGAPRFINPVLSVTDGDKDIAALVYSGLTRSLPDGTLGLDLADSYSISADGKTYSFVLRSDAKFHDGIPVTPDDIVFTVLKIQEASIKSNKRAYWEGVTVEKASEREVRFNLQQPYAPFIENTTIGILPKHVWKDLAGEQFISSTLNTNPIGSGPYKVGSIDRNAKGIPLSYTLDSNSEFYLGKPYIKNVVFKFYNSEKSLIENYVRGDVKSVSGISPDNAMLLKNEKTRILQTPLPRVFAVFFNQVTNKVLAYKEVRQALSLAVNRQGIVTSVLQGFGTPLDSAVPKSFTGEVQSGARDATSHHEEAIALLEKNGWLLNANGIREKKVGNTIIPLSFSISTSDAPELKEVAEHVQANWKQIGADVSIKIVEGGYLNQNVIKPRKYDALLFGQVVNRDLDLYAFWHSSQRDDPGLNVALYSNSTVDKTLEMMRIETKASTRQELYKKIESELQDDIPAIFLYSPHFIYVLPEELKGISLKQVSSPSERFSSIHKWYLNTDTIWKIFDKSQPSN